MAYTLTCVTITPISMTHSKAVIILDELVPSINSTGDPAGVFIKYAQDNNLAPAELERLCQLFNTAKSVTHMQKSASRGSSYSILPVSDIVEQYTTYTPKNKGVTKSAAFALNHDPFNPPDFNKLIDNGGETHLKQASDTLRWDEDAYQGLLKLAADQDAKQKEADEKAFMEGVVDFRENTLRSTWKMMDKIAMQITRDPSLLASLERDSLGVEGHNKKAFTNLVAWMGKYYSVTPYDRFDMTKAASVKLTRDTTGLLPLVTQLEAMLTNVEECDFLIKDATFDPFGDAPPGAGGAAGASTSTEDDSTQASLLGAWGDSIDQASPEDMPRVLSEILAEAETTDGAYDLPKGTMKQRLLDSGRVPEEVKASLGGGGKGGPPKDPNATGTGTGKEKKPPVDKPYTDYSASASPKAPEVEKTPATFEKRLDETVKSIGDASGKSVSWLADKLRSTNSFDSRRYKMDNARTSVRNALNLQKAMLTDPILSSADPARLVSLYNSLSTANPEVMADPNLLAYTLREAIQYDGVAPHTYEQLVGIDKSKAEADKNRTAAIDKEYSIN
jgi:hypothetical protein